MATIVPPIRTGPVRPAPGAPAFSGAAITDQFGQGTAAETNLALSCQGILACQIAPSTSPWYGPLTQDLQQLQNVARLWLNQFASGVRGNVLGCMAHAGQAFIDAKDATLALFDQTAANQAGAQTQLQARLTTLQNHVQLASTALTAYNQQLTSWSQSLQSSQSHLATTIGQIQRQENALTDQIAAINSTLTTLQGQVLAARTAIAAAESQRTQGIVQTVFGILFAPVTGGLSLIVAGVGVSSIVDAQNQVSQLEATISTALNQLAADQQQLSQDQAQISVLNALTLSAGVALHDAQAAGESLSAVQVTWAGFQNDLAGTLTKLSSAQDGSLVIVEKAWFQAAGNEMAVLINGINSLLAQPVSQRVSTCDICNLPVLVTVLTSTAPPLPDDLKFTFSSGPDAYVPASSVSVLVWQDHTYWFADFYDNRVSTCVVAFDAQGELVKRVEVEGARYLWKVELDSANSRLLGTGQANDVISIDLNSLAIS